MPRSGSSTGHRFPERALAEVVVVGSRGRFIRRRRRHMNMPHVSFRRWWKNGETVDLAASPPPPAPAPPAEPPWLKHLDRAGIPRTLNYPTTTLGRILDQSADRYGDVTALLYN